MVYIEPFKFNRCTAFKERVQIADKLNECIDVFNNAKLDEVPDTIETFNERITSAETNMNNLTNQIVETEVRVSNLVDEYHSEWKECENNDWSIVIDKDENGITFLKDTYIYSPNGVSQFFPKGFFMKKVNNARSEYNEPYAFILRSIDSLFCDKMIVTNLFSSLLLENITTGFELKGKNEQLQIDTNGKVVTHTYDTAIVDLSPLSDIVTKRRMNQTPVMCGFYMIYKDVIE